MYECYLVIGMIISYDYKKSIISLEFFIVLAVWDDVRTFIDLAHDRLNR